MDFENTDIESIGEVWKYEDLQSLTFINNRNLHSISGLEHCKKLKTLYLKGSGIDSYNPLVFMPQLETVYVDYMDEETQAKLKLVNPKLIIQTN